MLILQHGIANYGGGVVPTGTTEFILELTTISPNTTITIPHLSGYIYDYNVDYGDSTPINHVVAYNDTGCTHTYISVGVYQLKISGICETFYVEYTYPTIQSRVTKILQWGNVGLKSLCLWYFNNLTSIPIDTLGGLSKITDFSTCFNQCASLSSIPAGLFDYAISATTFSWTFAYCYGLTTIPVGLFNNNPLVTSMSGVFYGNYLITTIPTDIFKYNTNVTDMGYIFGGTGISLIPADLFKYNPNAQQFYYSFSNCNSLTSIPAGLFTGISYVNQIQGCFQYCGALTGLAPTLWVTYPSAYGSDCFRGSTGLSNYADIPEDWGGLYKSLRFVVNITDYATQSITISHLTGYTYDYNINYGDGYTYHITGATDPNCSHTYYYNSTFIVKISGVCETFYVNSGDTIASRITYIQTWGNVGLKLFRFNGCSNLLNMWVQETVDTTGGLSGVTDFSYAFADCVKLTTIPTGFFDYSLSADTFISTFQNCTGLTGNAPQLWVTFSAATGTNCFTGDTNLADYRFIPAAWGGLGLIRQPFKMELTLPTGSSTAIQLPHLNGYVYNYDIDYGDGTGIFHVSSYNDPNTQHTYTTGGTHVVQISGTCGSIYIWSDTIYQWVTKILQWGDTGFRVLAFMQCINLTEITGNTDGLTALSNANYMLYGSKITTIPTGFLSGLTTLNQTSEMFSNCTLLTSMGEGLFKNCTGLVYVNNMFQNCASLTGISATMFSGCTNLYNFSYLFQNCGSLVGSAPTWWITYPSAYGYDCFAGCWGLSNYLVIPTGPTGWGGPGIDPSIFSGFTYFMKSNYADWNTVYDNISSNVHITRKNSQPIFNIVTESGWNAYTSPDDTEWNWDGWTGISGITDVSGRTYDTWYNITGGNPYLLPGMELVLHTITDNQYFKLMFIGWTQGNSGGGFAYYRKEIT